MGPHMVDKLPLRAAADSSFRRTERMKHVRRETLLGRFRHSGRV